MSWVCWKGRSRLLPTVADSQRVHAVLRADEGWRDEQRGTSWCCSTGHRRRIFHRLPTGRRRWWPTQDENRTVAGTGRGIPILSVQLRCSGLMVGTYACNSVQLKFEEGYWQIAVSIMLLHTWSWAPANMIMDFTVVSQDLCMPHQYSRIMWWPFTDVSHSSTPCWLLHYMSPVAITCDQMAAKFVNICKWYSIKRGLNNNMIIWGAKTN